MNENEHICAFKTVQEIVSTALLAVCLRGQTEGGEISVVQGVFCSCGGCVKQHNVGQRDPQVGG